MNALVGFFAVVGFITVSVLSLAFLWYIYTRRPTPNATVKEAITSLSWPHAFGFFIAPTTVAGAMEGTPVLGFLFGFGSIAFILLLQWWMGPL